MARIGTQDRLKPITEYVSPADVAASGTMKGGDPRIAADCLVIPRFYDTV